MAIVFPYVKNTTWADGPGGGTSIDAADLNKIEDGIFNAHQQPVVRVFNSTNLTLTTGVEFALTFDSERIDQAGGSASTMHSTVSNSQRLTAIYAGVYLIVGNAQFAANATSYRQLRIRLNGTTFLAAVSSPSNTAAIATKMQISTIYSMAVNDYVELLALQNSGGNLDIENAANISPEWSMVRVA